jgi:hypothetical protein
VTKIESHIKNTITSEAGKYHTLGLTNAFRVFFYGADRNELIAETEKYTEEYWND